jgi:hypothetical protein
MVNFSLHILPPTLNLAVVSLSHFNSANCIAIVVAFEVFHLLVAPRHGLVTANLSYEQKKDRDEHEAEEDQESTENVTVLGLVRLQEENDHSYDGEESSVDNGDDPVHDVVERQGSFNRAYSGLVPLLRIVRVQETFADALSLATEDQGK